MKVVCLSSLSMETNRAFNALWIQPAKLKNMLYEQNKKGFNVKVQVDEELVTMEIASFYVLDNPYIYL